MWYVSVTWEQYVVAFVKNILYEWVERHADFV